MIMMNNSNNNDNTNNNSNKQKAKTQVTRKPVKEECELNSSSEQENVDGVRTNSEKFISYSRGHCGGRLLLRNST